MSTKRTQNYQLHAWEPGDDFLLREINENFAALEAAARIVVGTYTGDGAVNQLIELGFTPKAVLVTNSKGEMNKGYDSYGGLALPGFPATHWVAGPIESTVEIAENGFTVAYRTNGSYTLTTNKKGELYYFLIVK